MNEQELKKKSPQLQKFLLKEIEGDHFVNNPQPHVKVLNVKPIRELRGEFQDLPEKFTLKPSLSSKIVSTLFAICAGIFVLQVFPSKDFLSLIGVYLFALIPLMAIWFAGENNKLVLTKSSMEHNGEQIKWQDIVSLHILIPLVVNEKKERDHFLIVEYKNERIRRYAITDIRTRNYLLGLFSRYTESELIGHYIACYFEAQQD